jgi:hypothetical protein
VRMRSALHPDERMVWFSDLTRWLDGRGNGWAALGIDGRQALLRMPELNIVGLYMTISKRAHHHLINTAERLSVHHPGGGSEVLGGDERERVRAAFLDQLDRDWPELIAELRGRLMVDGVQRGRPAVIPTGPGRPGQSDEAGASSADSEVTRMVTWEYALARLEGGIISVFIGDDPGMTTFHYFGPRDLHTCCDRLGADGWELVNCSASGRGITELIFKRPSGTPR